MGIATAKGLESILGLAGKPENRRFLRQRTSQPLRTVPEPHLTDEDRALAFPPNTRRRFRVIRFLDTTAFAATYLR